MYVYGACVVATVWGSVAMFVVKDIGFFSLGVLKYVECLSNGCGGCCVFCLYGDAWSCRCLCMGSMSV